MPPKPGGPPTWEEIAATGEHPYTQEPGARLVAKRAVEDMKEFCWHKFECAFLLDSSDPCNCGFDLRVAAWTRFAEGGGDDR